MEVVFGGFDLCVVEANVGVVGKGQANSVVERQDQLAVDDVISKALGRGKRRGGRLTSRDAEILLEARVLLSVQASGRRE